MNQTRQIGFLYATEFITGACVLTIEILGTRILAPYYGSTIFVWSSLICITLGFLALGYGIGGKLSDKNPKVNILAMHIVVAGTFLLLILHIDTWVLQQTNVFGSKYGPLVSALILFAIPLYCLGTVSPFVVKLRTQTFSELGGTAGTIFAIGTVGSLVGALLSGFFLIPFFSITTILSAAAMVLIFLAAALSFFFDASLRLALLAIPICISHALLPYYNVVLQDDVEILHQESGFFGTVKVYSLFDKITCIMIDNFSQSCWNIQQDSSAWAYTRYFRALTNHFSDEEKPLDILILGLGGGSVVKEWAPEGNSIDVIEINPQIISVAHEYFGLPGEAEGVQYIEKDARYYVQNTTKKYDIVVMDIVLGGSSTQHLATKEFFQEVQSTLKPNGIFAMQTKGWLSSQKLQPMVFKTLKSSFDTVKVTAQNKDDVGSIAYYASDRDIEYAPFLLKIPFLAGKEIWEGKFEYSSLPLITDNNNPTAILNFPVMSEERSSTIESFGHGIFLHKPNRQI